MVPFALFYYEYDRKQIFVSVMIYDTKMGCIHFDTSHSGLIFKILYFVVSTNN